MPPTYENTEENQKQPISGLNWPSSVLHVWLALHEQGVPAERMRFLPEVGHFAAPEAGLERVEPEEIYSLPRQEPLAEAPEDVFVRLSVNVRCDPHPRRPDEDVFSSTPSDKEHRPAAPPGRNDNLRSKQADAPGLEPGEEEHCGDADFTVGRLAHFFKPLQSGLREDGVSVPVPPLVSSAGKVLFEKPLDHLARQMQARYPELIGVLPSNTRQALEGMLRLLHGALDEIITLLHNAREEITAWRQDARLSLDENAQQEMENLLVQLLQTRVRQSAQIMRTTARRTAQTLRQWESVTEHQAAYWILADKVQQAYSARTETLVPEAVTYWLRAWDELLFAPVPLQERDIEQFLTGLFADDLEQFWSDSFPEAAETESELLVLLRAQAEMQTQRELLAQMLYALGQDKAADVRKLVVRELVEIVTTEVFQSVAAIDMLWGLQWAHGRLSDFRLSNSRVFRPGARLEEGWLLSLTGGMDPRTLLMNLLREWCGQEGCLGVEETPHSAGAAEEGVGQEKGGEHLDIGLFTPAQQWELWGLVAWRRQALDPLPLLEAAAQRLIDPGIRIQARAFADMEGRLNTLFAQINSTAILNQTPSLYYPGVAICLPFPEPAPYAQAKREKQAKADAAAGVSVQENAWVEAKLCVLLRLFLPIGCRSELIWQEAVARLDRPTYLNHEFSKTRLTHSGAL